MKLSDDLYVLIKSMSKSEKRYFKLFASFHSGDKKYLLLFDAMDKMGAYDEDLLKAGFKEERFLLQFSVAKNYLYKLVIKSLAAYQRGKCRSSEIRELLEQTEVLYMKGLYHQAIKQIERAKSIAKDYEKYLLMADILQWERKIHILLRNHDQLKKLPAEFSGTIEKLKNINDYQQLSTQLWMLFGEKGKVRNQEDRQIFDVIHANSYLSDETLALTTEAKWFYNNAHVFYYRVTGEYHKAYAYGKRLFQLIEAVPGMKYEEINTYVSSLGNFMLILQELRKKEECLLVIKKLRALGSEKSLGMHENILARIFVNSYLQEIDVHIVTGDYASAEKLIPEIEKGLNTHDAQMTAYDKTSFYYLIANIYFGLSKYKNSLFWLNKVLDNAHIRPDYQPMARILNMIIHFELGNTEIMEYIIKSTYRFLKKQNKLFRFETIMLNYIKKFPWITTKKQLIDSFKELRKELVELKKDHFEKMALEYFDIISWLDQKIDDFKGI